MVLSSAYIPGFNPNCQSYFATAPVKCAFAAISWADLRGLAAKGAALAAVAHFGFMMSGG
jgi:hypothetical protein